MCAPIEYRQRSNMDPKETAMRVQCKPMIVRRPSKKTSTLREFLRRALADTEIGDLLYQNMDAAVRRSGINLSQQDIEAIQIVGQRGAFLDEVEADLRSAGIEEAQIPMLKEFRTIVVAS